MDRRKFLQVLSASAVAVAMPLTLISDDVVAKPGPHYEFKRFTAEHDFGAAIGLGVSTYVGGQRFRSAVMTTTENWKSMTDNQKEQLWRVAEQGCIACIQRSTA